MTIKSGDFAHISNPKLEADGLELGSTVYVASTQLFPLTEEDGYTLRVKLFVHKTTEEFIDIKGGLFVIDPCSVTELQDWEQTHLLDKYAPKDVVLNDMKVDDATTD